MSWSRVTALAAVLVALAGRARAAPSTILVPSGGPAAEEVRLVEALRIYTRDVDGRLVLEGTAPSTLDRNAVERLVDGARREQADVIVWCARRADGRVVFYALDVETRDLHETEVEAVGAERAAQDLALKVRSILYRGRGRSPDEPARVAAKPEPRPAGVPVAAPAPPAIASASRPAAIATTPVPTSEATAIVARSTPAAPAPPHRLGLGAAYAFLVPSGATWLRHGVLLGAEARLGRDASSPLSLVFDAAITTKPTSIVRGYDVTVSDVPIGLSLLLTRSGAAATLAAGPRASLHVFDVTADDADGRAGAVRRYALGIGGAGRLGVQLAAYMKVFVGVTIEALIPKQQLTIAGQPALDTGSMLTTGAVGLEWLLL